MWIDLNVRPECLRLSMVFPTGQLFTWKEIRPGYWMGVIRSLVVEFNETPETIKYRIINENNPINSKYKKSDIHSFISNLFNLKYDINDIISTFKDKKLIDLTNRYKGLRVLQQDPIECVFSFICSANNNIKRITKMVNSLKVEAGIPLGDGWYQFPELEKLAEIDPERLKKLGFGFRASRIPDAAKQIIDLGGVEWLHDLKSRSLIECRNELTKITGIGVKIADCICLYSLGFMNCIPLDVHLLRVSRRYTNNKGYKNIQKDLEQYFGPFGGWAQCYLYYDQINKINQSHNNHRLYHGKTSPPS